MCGKWLSFFCFVFCFFLKWKHFELLFILASLTSNKSPSPCHTVYFNCQATWFSFSKTTKPALGKRREWERYKTSLFFSTSLHALKKVNVIFLFVCLNTKITFLWNSVWHLFLGNCTGSCGNYSRFLKAFFFFWSSGKDATLSPFKSYLIKNANKHQKHQNTGTLPIPLQCCKLLIRQVPHWAFFLLKRQKKKTHMCNELHKWAPGNKEAIKQLVSQSC